MQEHFENGSENKSACPRSPEYEAVMEAFARNLYDPSKLGNLADLTSKHNCDIKSPSDAIDWANAEMIMLDPHSKLLAGDDLADFVRSQTSQLAGIGVTFERPQAVSLATDVGPLLITDLLSGAPAEKAGLRIGDEVLAVDGKPVDAESVGGAVSRIKGKPGTSVDLTIRRDGLTFDLDVSRALVHFPVVADKELDGDIAYLSISNFMSNSGPAEMQAALKRHENADAVVLDLRDNHGGNLDKAMDVASLFMNTGLLYTSQERLDSPMQAPTYINHTYALTADSKVVTGGDDASIDPRLPDLVHVPVVVLVNGETASASETLAAALRENDDATIVGTQTFGKGVGQHLIPVPLANGMLKVTNFKAQTAEGDWVGDGANQRIGLTPDIVVEQPKGVRSGGADDAQLNEAVRYLQGQIAAGQN